ncbi:MAG: tol-pal system protein YbgF [Methylophilales bacterium]|nr:tol-pal system protein YbgF [Methylophilales bacterium]
MKKLVLALCLLLGGVSAAQAGLFDDDEARAKIIEQQKAILQLQAQAQALQTKLDDEQKQRLAVDGRVTTLEKSQTLLDMLNQIEQLKAEITRLNGKIEVIARDIEVTQQRQRDLYTDIDARLRKLETPPAPVKEPVKESANSEAVPPATPNASPQEANPSTPTPPADVAADNSAAENKDYEAAHALFKAGKYPQSATAFEKFQETYPNSKFAGNAQYWLGYARFSQRDYKAAMAAQQKMVKTYPDHPKVPDAMYNIANSQIQLSDIDGARQTLKNIVAKYPLSDAAGLAKKRLSQLEAIKSKN